MKQSVKSLRLLIKYLLSEIFYNQCDANQINIGKYNNLLKNKLTVL